MLYILAAHINFTKKKILQVKKVEMEAKFPQKPKIKLLIILFGRACHDLTNWIKLLHVETRKERRCYCIGHFSFIFKRDFSFSVLYHRGRLGRTVSRWVKSAWNVIILFVVQNWILSDSAQQPETEFHNEPRKQELRKNNI